MKKQLLILCLLATVPFRTYSQVNWMNIMPAGPGPLDTLCCISAMAYDKQGQLWVSGITYDGSYDQHLFYFDGVNWNLLPVIFPSSLSEATMRTMAIDTNNVLWFCTAVFWGGYVYDIDNMVDSSISFPGACSHANSVIVDAINNSKWFFNSDSNQADADGSILKYDGINFYCFDSLATGIHYTFDALASNGILYVTTDSDELVKYDGVSWTHINPLNSNLPAGNSIGLMTCDHLGNIWCFGYLGTNRCLYKYDGTSFTAYPLNFNGYNMQCISLSFYRSIACDIQNRIWLSSDVQGLICFDGTNWIAYCPYSSTLISFPPEAGFLVDSLDNIWVANQGGSSVNGLLLFNERGLKAMSGNVYDDVNQNGVRDSVENGMLNEVVHASSGFNALTNLSGNYFVGFLDSSQTYQLGPVLKPYHFITSLPSSYSVTPISQSTTGLDFGIGTIPNVNDLRITADVFPVRPGFTSMMYIDYDNIGTTMQSDSVQCTFDPLYTFMNAWPSPDDINSNTLKWSYGSLAPGDHGSIMLELVLSASAVIGDSVHFQSTIFPVANDTVPSDNINLLSEVIRGSCDPNEKHVTPEFISSSNDYLKYTIFFQNTGNDTAFNITVMDTLDMNLDASTFELLGSSHPVSVNLSGAGNLKFIFYNILLPDSNINEPLSHGFVSFRVKPVQGLSIGTQIPNKAYIYFDYNLPVVTNTANSVVVSVKGEAGQSIQHYIQVYPDPADDYITVYSMYLTKPGELMLTDIAGRIINKYKMTAQQQKISLKGVNNGIYFLQWRRNNIVINKKIIVQHSIH